MSKPIHALLRQKTHEAHSALDSLPIVEKLFAPDATPAIYADYLGRHLAVIGPFENVWPKVPDFSTTIPDLEVRKKVPALHADLTALDAQFPKPVEWIEPKNTAFALGALYVIEGSSLGNQVILKTLRQHPFINSANTNYLTGRGSEIGKSWQGFLRALDEFTLQQPDQEDLILEGAHAAFAAFAQSMRQ